MRMRSERATTVPGDIKGTTARTHLRISECTTRQVRLNRPSRSMASGKATHEVSVGAVEMHGAGVAAETHGVGAAVETHGVGVAEAVTTTCVIAAVAALEDSGTSSVHHHFCHLRTITINPMATHLVGNMSFSTGTFLHDLPLRLAATHRRGMPHRACAPSSCPRISFLKFV